MRGLFLVVLEGRARPAPARGPDRVAREQVGSAVWRAVEIAGAGEAFKDWFRDLRRGAERRLLPLRAIPSSCCSCIGGPPNDRKVPHCGPSLSENSARWTNDRFDEAAPQRPAKKRMGAPGRRRLHKAHRRPRIPSRRRPERTLMMLREYLRLIGSPQAPERRKMDVESPITRVDLLAMISEQIPEVYPDYDIKRTEALATRVLDDLYILARCAISKCRVTYTDAISLRGYGNRQNGRWLDDVYSFAISPLGFPDLTMLVVNASTGQPSEDAFEARRSKLSEIQISEVPREQNRCIWFDAYEAVLRTAGAYSNGISLRTIGDARATTRGRHPSGSLKRDPTCEWRRQDEREGWQGVRGLWELLRALSSDEPAPEKAERSLRSDRPAFRDAHGHGRRRTG